MKDKAKNMAAYFFHQGTSDSAYLYLGCHLEKKDSEGYTYAFRVWAPSASYVTLVSDFTDWDTGLPLQRVTDAGVWELLYTSPVSLEGRAYKLRIDSLRGGIRLKGDPYAFASRGGSDGASIVTHPSSFVWEDEAFLRARREAVSFADKHFLSCPLNIYELHAASFDRHDDGSYLSYRELADKLVGYVKYMGYTHVELLPLAEYPYDGSWGYQVCGFYAPTSRFGTPDDLRYFVNTLHKAGVGVIMDWVPAHFPKDEWGLYEFDGQPLYEYQGRDRMESSSWGTRFFDLGREEVQSFLVSNAMYWLREFHIDGLRVDAVASMLYLDYDRLPGEWVPNVYGDNRNLEAIAFLQKLNGTIDREFPDALMIAEESTSFASVTKPTSEGGLGFDLKWNMGWANDFYDYVSKDPIWRRYHHKALNFPILYAYNENYILPISHDEVVHGKRSFLDKMAGSYEDKFKAFRASMMFMMSFPGKKMLFMGTEYGQFVEWNYARPLEWFMLDYPAHRSLRDFVRALNAFYLATPALYERDFDPSGFSWILADEADKNLVAYRRTDANGEGIIAVISFSGVAQSVALPMAEESYTVVFDSFDSKTGSELLTSGDGLHKTLFLTLSPYEALYLKETEKLKTIKL